eukprot:1088990-Rhodomonas_salina.1
MLLLNKQRSTPSPLDPHAAPLAPCGSPPLGPAQALAFFFLGFGTSRPACPPAPLSAQHRGRRKRGGRGGG